MTEECQRLPSTPSLRPRKGCLARHKGRRAAAAMAPSSLERRWPPRGRSAPSTPARLHRGVPTGPLYDAAAPRLHKPKTMPRGKGPT